MTPCFSVGRRIVTGMQCVPRSQCLQKLASDRIRWFQQSEICFNLVCIWSQLDSKANSEKHPCLFWLPSGRYAPEKAIPVRTKTAIGIHHDWNVRLMLVFADVCLKILVKVDTQKPPFLENAWNCFLCVWSYLKAGSHTCIRLRQSSRDLLRENILARWCHLWGDSGTAFH